MSKNSCVIYAPVDTLSGYGSRARDTVKSIIQLKKDEWDIKIIPCGWGNTPTGFIEENPEWQFLTSHFINGQLTSQPDIFIWITIPTEFQKVGKFNIGITAGIETTAAAGEWIDGLNKMNMNIVTSKHSKKVFEEADYVRTYNDGSGRKEQLRNEKPLEVCFWGADTKIYKKTEEKIESIEKVMERIPEKFAFLFIGQWTHRNTFHDRKDIGKYPASEGWKEVSIGVKEEVELDESHGLFKYNKRS